MKKESMRQKQKLKCVIRFNYSKFAYRIIRDSHLKTKDPEPGRR